MPTISIIVPVYNTEKYLHRCIDSILAQTFTDFELLLIDDGSTDRSGVICDEYVVKDSRVRGFHKENGGVSSARNLGLDYARGEWIAFIDSDDWIDNSYLSKMYNISYGVDIVYSNLYMVYNNKKEKYDLASSSYNKSLNLINWISEVWTIVATSLIKRELFEKNSLRFSTRINYCEDMILSIQLRFYGKKTLQLKENLYYYNRTNESSITKSKANYMLNEERKAYMELFSFFKSEGVFDSYKQYLYWRIIDLKQGWLMDEELFDNFLKFIPEAISELWSCPKVSVKRKIMIWCITHHCSFVSKFMLKCYKVKKCHLF